LPIKSTISNKVTIFLIYGRLPLVFGGMLCAVGVLWAGSSFAYLLGVLFLLLSMTFDLIDGWFAARFRPQPLLAHLADRIMDKLIYSIVFPLVAVGTMWRFKTLSPQGAGPDIELLHAIFVFFLCLTVLIRDNFAHFLRGFALRKGQEPEPREFTRLRTVAAAPVGALLYIRAFYVPAVGEAALYQWISWLAHLPLHFFFFIEILFLIINFGSIGAYCAKYGSQCLDELSLGDEHLRRRILAFFPNALTVINAVMGLIAIVFAHYGQIAEAYLMLIGAALFDKLDGALARRLGLTEPLPDEDDRRITLGAILDDVADSVSFCLAPALIFYFSLSGTSNPVIHSLPVGFISLAYALLGITRLIYFTFDRNPVPGYFKGMPTPAAALLVVAPLILFADATQQGAPTAGFWGIFCSVLMVFAGLVMNLYPVRYIHLGRVMSRHPWFARLTAVIGLFFVFTPYFAHAALTYMFLYMLSPLITLRAHPGKTNARKSR